MTADDTLQVRVSVDGTRVSRKSNFVIMTYAILNGGNVLSSSENKVLAVVNGPEEYETLRDSFSDLFNPFSADDVYIRHPR